MNIQVDTTCPLMETLYREGQPLISSVTGTPSRIGADACFWVHDGSAAGSLRLGNMLWRPEITGRCGGETARSAGAPSNSRRHMIRRRDQKDRSDWRMEEQQVKMAIQWLTNAETGDRARAIGAQRIFELAK